MSGTDTPKAGGADLHDATGRLTVATCTFAEYVELRTADVQLVLGELEKLQQRPPSPAPLATGGTPENEALSRWPNNGTDRRAIRDAFCQGAWWQAATSPTRVGDGELLKRIEAEEAKHAVARSEGKTWAVDESPQINLTTAELRAALRASDAGGGKSFVCAARLQTLPELADCDWPLCGCDPYARKVVEALEEGGALAAPPPPAAGGHPDGDERGLWPAGSPPRREPPAAGAMPMFPSFWDEGEGGRGDEGVGS